MTFILTAYLVFGNWRHLVADLLFEYRVLSIEYWVLSTKTGWCGWIAPAFNGIYYLWLTIYYLFGCGERWFLVPECLSSLVKRQVDANWIALAFNGIYYLWLTIYYLFECGERWFLVPECLSSLVKRQVRCEMNSSGLQAGDYMSEHFNPPR